MREFACDTGTMSPKTMPAGKDTCMWASQLLSKLGTPAPQGQPHWLPGLIALTVQVIGPALLSLFSPHTHPANSHPFPECPLHSKDFPTPTSSQIHLNSHMSRFLQEVLGTKLCVPIAFLFLISNHRCQLTQSWLGKESSRIPPEASYTTFTLWTLHLLCPPKFSHTHTPTSTSCADTALWFLFCLFILVWTTLSSDWGLLQYYHGRILPEVLGWSLGLLYSMPAISLLSHFLGLLHINLGFGPQLGVFRALS